MDRRGAVALVAEGKVTLLMTPIAQRQVNRPLRIDIAQRCAVSPGALGAKGRQWEVAWIIAGAPERLGNTSSIRQPLGSATSM